MIFRVAAFCKFHTCMIDSNILLLVCRSCKAEVNDEVKGSGCLPGLFHNGPGAGCSRHASANYWLRGIQTYTFL